MDHDIAMTAARHGQELASHDFTIEQVVQDYGDLCQSITELAVERAAPITVREFGSLNNTLDKAIASAVASYSAQHEARFTDVGQLEGRERLGILANAMRNLLNTAILAASAMRRGSVGIGGATAASLDRSLIAMRGLIDRSLADVRLETRSVEPAEVIEVGPFIAEVQLAAVFEAANTQCELTVVVQPDIFMRGDRHLLASAVANLLHRSVTSTQRNGEAFSPPVRDGAHHHRRRGRMHRPRPGAEQMIERLPARRLKSRIPLRRDSRGRGNSGVVRANGSRALPLYDRRSRGSMTRAHAATRCTAKACAMRSTAFLMFSIDVAKEMRR
jgi:hypothetical protein